MSENTKIEWCDHTFNPWIGCTQVGPGCDNCYAKAWDRRFAVSGHAMHWGAGQARSRTKTWGDPVKWNKTNFYECSVCGWRGSDKDDEFSRPKKGCIHILSPARQRVFCASLADVFDNAVPNAWRMDLFNLIASTPNLDWLILTKRIGNVMTMCSGDSLMFDLICERVWLGATVVNQEEADRDIPKLLSVPAAKRFLSIEPLLGPVILPFDRLREWNRMALLHQQPHAAGRIDWVIVGGESGHNARPMHPDWARSLKDQCESAGVPFLFKQWGKKAAGRLLDGREWNGVPA